MHQRLVIEVQLIDSLVAAVGITEFRVVFGFYGILLDSFTPLPVSARKNVITEEEDTTQLDTAIP